jgi:hypothetical protein
MSRRLNSVKRVYDMDDCFVRAGADSTATSTSGFVWIDLNVRSADEPIN